MQSKDENNFLNSSSESDKLQAKRKKRLVFRANHRGIKEMDIILGRFAIKEIDKLTNADLNELEYILSIDDRDLYAFVTGEQPIPETLNTRLFSRILQQKM